MRNLPHYAFEHNQTWLEVSLIAQDLLCWTKLICLTEISPEPNPSASANGCCTSPPSSSATAGAPGSTRPRLALVPTARRRIHAPTREPGALLKTPRSRLTILTNDSAHPPASPTQKRPPGAPTRPQSARRPGRPPPRQRFTPPFTPPRPNRGHHHNTNGASRLSMMRSLTATSATNSWSRTVTIARRLLTFPWVV